MGKENLYKVYMEICINVEKYIHATDETQAKKEVFKNFSKNDIIYKRIFFEKVDKIE